ncbi:hypothetical protein SDJN03_05676, partial [Cucurbita argyrosperma subsp. sororia]
MLVTVCGGIVVCNGSVDRSSRKSGENGVAACFLPYFDLLWRILSEVAKLSGKIGKFEWESVLPPPSVAGSCSEFHLSNGLQHPEECYEVTVANFIWIKRRNFLQVFWFIVVHYMQARSSNLLHSLWAQVGIKTH